MSERYDHRALIGYAHDALAANGLETGYAQIVAETLVEGDLLGHSTHGLALLPRYLQELAAGQMTKAGEPTIVRDQGASAAWDGNYLPGPVLVRRALALCAQRARDAGVATVAIGKSHHVACLAAYLKAVTDKGMAAIIASSSPATASVAPFGAVEGIYSPNPIAAGWPTGGDPVLVDISASITTNSLVSERVEEGRRLPGPWMISPDGTASDDPALLTAKPAGALLPLGGTEYGHKGFALGLIVEMLTAGLSGHGRADAPDQWGASVFVMVVDPAHHGGRAAFERQTGFMATAARGAAVPDGASAVRLPGERALRLRRQQITDGVVLSDALLARLRKALPDRPLNASL
ncbi:Ldh family oxidoreductase [Aurantimonas sp. A2-1-M11]|uniref:Ldh family oxidoreductase n=1 Tax=Aurantimonas sp. A2-1-M11 TaxID=3113712 RepID=UPI002F950682